MFIILRSLGLKRRLDMEMMRVRPANHRHEAEATPIMKRAPFEAGRAAWKAPSIIVPSMRAWGLNHVTTQAEQIVLFIDVLAIDVSALDTAWSSGLDLSRLIPMRTTMIPPASRIIILSNWKRSMSAPIPKKQARAKVTSKKITIRAVIRARRRVCASAEFITKRFWRPMGAT